MIHAVVLSATEAVCLCPRLCLEPQQPNASGENTDAIISEAFLASVVLASSLPLRDDLFMNGRLIDSRLSQSSSGSARRCQLIGWGFFKGGEKSELRADRLKSPSLKLHF